MCFISIETTTTTDRRARCGYAYSRSYVAIVKDSKFVPQERIAGRVCEHVVDVSVPQVVEQLSVVLKISSQTEFCSVPSNRFLAVPVPHMIEQLLDVLKFVSQDRIQQRTLEQISDTHVPQVVEELVGLHSFHQDGVQLRFVELTIETASRISLTEEMKEAPKIKRVRDREGP